MDKKEKNMKITNRLKRRARAAGRILAAVLAVLTLLTALAGCGQSDPPPLAEIYDETVALIEKSHAMNDLMFGYGLPVWKIDSDYAALNYLYGKDTKYEYVTEYAGYVSIDGIKEALEEVYSADYLTSLYETLFDGYMYGYGFKPAQIREDGSWLLQSADYEPLLKDRRTYDYASMRIVKPSSATYVTVELESYVKDSTEADTVRLGLILEDGHWRLDSPTY